MLDGSIPYFAATRTALSPALQREIECQDSSVNIYDSPNTIAFHWDRATMPALAALFEAKEGLALDFGCGVGYFREHAPQFDVIGVDVAPQLLRRAHARGGTVAGADVAQLPFRDATFDLVFSRGVLHHLVDPHVALRELFRVLKPGGEAVFHDTREFRAVEWTKKKLRRGSRFFAETHTAFPRAAYRRMIEEAGLLVDREEDWDPLSIPLVSLADAVGLGPKVDGHRWVEKLLAVDRWFNRYARRLPGLKHFGSINVIHARKSG